MQILKVREHTIMPPHTKCCIVSVSVAEKLALASSKAAAHLCTLYLHTSAFLSHQHGQFYYSTVRHIGNTQRLTFWIVVWMLDDKSLTLFLLL